MSSRLKTNPEKMFRVIFELQFSGKLEVPLVTLIVMNTLVGEILYTLGND
jgi:hypothetical protein